MYGAKKCTFLHIDCRALLRSGQDPQVEIRLRSRLGAARDRSQLAWQEVIRRPGPADDQLAILQLLGGTAIAVLILLHRLRVNQVGDVDHHPIGVDSLATNLFFEGVEHLVDLDRQAARLGLTFAVFGSLDRKSVV